METKFIAHSSKVIQAPLKKVWEAFVDPEIIKQYMFGTDVVSDWKEGSSIVWKGEWKGKSYEDKGTILKIEKFKTLQYSHYSPLAGKPDMEENYHTVTITLSEIDLNMGVKVKLTKDNNETEEEQKNSENNWDAMLEGLKKFLEKDNK